MTQSSMSAVPCVNGSHSAVVVVVDVAVVVVEVDVMVVLVTVVCVVVVVDAVHCAYCIHASAQAPGLTYGRYELVAYPIGMGYAAACVYQSMRAVK